MRVSIARRLDRCRDILIPPGSLAHREANLSEPDRAALQMHRGRTAAIMARLKNPADPGAAYAAYLADPLILPQLPRHLEAVLWPELARVRAEPDLAIAYSLMLETEMVR